MTTAHDIYAETNPAFCAAVLAGFCDSYQSIANRAPELVLSYIVLPIILSDDLSNTFDHTNKNTGLLEWLHRAPQILNGLAGRINTTLQITTNGIQYGCMTKLLLLNSDGTISSLNQSLPKAIIKDSLTSTFKRARLLGDWMAMTGSTRNVIEALGISV